MSLRLYLDDCAYRRQLRRVLQQAGHEVVIPADAGLAGAHDSEHFAYACAHRLVLITRNRADFVRLAAGAPDHPGVLLSYRDNDRSRDMTDAEVARAIGNLVATGVPVAGAVHVLNHWPY